VHSNPGELVVDFFAGSGTTGVAAAKNNRKFALVDANPEAVQIAAKRLTEYAPDCIGFTPEPQVV
jgi:site-specific DNA-methyltransferase (adenine-specific)